ncbi:MAG TPA: DUF6502 family protein [Steroidobacteraceae bacterium]|nr:DUF6502 family protein [Steroidobacteraceae bacterium]
MNLKSCLLAAVRHMLIPIARILIRNGVAYSDFDAAARHAFAKGGESVLNERSLAVTLARLSVLTGLTQKEIERVMHNASQYGMSASGDWLAAARVLHAWHTKPPFVLVPIGVPLELEYEASDTKNTFVELVQTHVPDADPSLMLAILLTSGAVAQDERGRLRATTRTFLAGEVSEIQIRYVARTVRRFLDTLDVNLTEGGRQSGRFERSVTADRGVPTRRYDEFVSYIRSMMQKTLEDVDEWIAANAAPEAGEPVLWTGIGMYHWLEQPEDLEVAFRDVVDDTTRLEQGS